MHTKMILSQEQAYTAHLRSGSTELQGKVSADALLLCRLGGEPPIAGRSIAYHDRVLSKKITSHMYIHHTSVGFSSAHTHAPERPGLLLITHDNTVINQAQRTLSKHK